MSKRHDLHHWRPFPPPRGPSSPIVSVTLDRGESRTSTFSGLLDSGASFTIVHADWARALGIADITTGTSQRFEGLGSGIGWGFAVNVNVWVGQTALPLQYIAGNPPLVYFMTSFTWKSTMLVGTPHLAGWKRVAFDAAGQRSWTTTRG